MHLHLFMGVRAVNLVGKYNAPDSTYCSYRCVQRWSWTGGGAGAHTTKRCIRPTNTAVLRAAYCCCPCPQSSKCMLSVLFGKVAPPVPSRPCSIILKLLVRTPSCSVVHKYTYIEGDTQYANNGREAPERQPPNPKACFKRVGGM